jgi:hypothetical protein
MQNTDMLSPAKGYNGAYDNFTKVLDARNAEYGPRPDGKDWVWTRDIVPTRVYIGVKGKMEDGTWTWTAKKRRCTHVLTKAFQVVMLPRMTSLLAMACAMARSTDTRLT